MSAPPAESAEPKLAANPIVRLFASADLRSLGLFRIVLGLLLIVDLWPRIAQVDSFYSNDGVLTNHYSLFRPLASYQFSLYVAASSTRDVTFVLLLTGVVYLLFLVGYRTRLFHILSFVCVTSLHVRNLLVELPSDVVLHLWMAWSLFLPLGARFSIDGLRKSLRERREKSPAELNERPAAPLAFSSFAVLGITLQLAAMHIGAALRQSGASWTDGSALSYALHHNLWASDFGASLAKSLSRDALKSLTMAYRFSEIGLGVLVLVPVTFVRRVTIALLVLFHLASRMLFDVGPYDLAVLGGAPLLLSTRDWAALGAWYARRKHPLVVYFDADCGICFMICRWLARFDLLDRLTFVANSSESAPPEVRAAAAETVVVRDEKTGHTFTKSRAMAAIFASLPFGALKSLALRAPGISALADIAYDKVAKNRAEISVWLGFPACGVPRPAPAGARVEHVSPWHTFTQGLAVTREILAIGFFALSGLAFWHASLPEQKAPNLAEPINAALSYPRIFQKFGLFAPEPPKVLGTVVVDAWNGRGLRFDPLNGGLPRESPDRERKVENSVRPSPLMSTYFTNIADPSRSTYLDGLKDYVSRISDDRPPSERPTAYTVSWIEQPIDLGEGGAASPQSSQATFRRLTARP